MSKKISILLVEDDPYFSLRVKKTLEEFGPVSLANSEQVALNLVKSEVFDIAFIDLNLSFDDSLGGLKVLKETIEKNIYSIVLSNNEQDFATKSAYSIGCKHFLRKKHFNKSLRQYIENFLRTERNHNWDHYFQKSFITSDLSLKNNIKNLSSVNLYNQNIFLSGETGVGKTHLAKLLHSMTYDNKNFVHFNCSEIPKELIDSELFGYEKGAFTGADKPRKGLLELADGGTLFLDEIATMPLYTQKKLLKVLDDKEFSPLGSNEIRKVSFTLICATCENLQDLISQKKFREDLFYRISGFEINIPPLRQRKQDIENQIFHFLSQSERRFFLEEETFNILINYDWPGNTRELQKLLNALSLSSEGVITTTHPLLEKVSNQSIKKENNQTQGFINNLHLEFIKSYGLKAFIKKIEKSALMQVHKKNDFKVTKTIKDLSISNSQFYRIHPPLDSTQ